jgi:hypothetical protein
MSAGHCFKSSDDFSKYTLTFGNFRGDSDEKYARKQCTLDELGPFKGSIGYNGTRQFFPGHRRRNRRNRRHNRRKCESGEDYCMLVLSGMTAEDTRIEPLNVENLLECGHGDYLKYQPHEALTIFGHPGQEKGSQRPLRVCWGKEKGEEDRILEYKMDTLPGNSGSPIIGRVTKCLSCSKLAEEKKKEKKLIVKTAKHTK